MPPSARRHRPRPRRPRFGVGTLSEGRWLHETPARRTRIPRGSRAERPPAEHRDGAIGGGGGLGGRALDAVLSEALPPDDRMRSTQIDAVTSVSCLPRPLGCHGRSRPGQDCSGQQPFRFNEGDAFLCPPSPWTQLLRDPPRFQQRSSGRPVGASDWQYSRHGEF